MAFQDLHPDYKRTWFDSKINPFGNWYEPLPYPAKRMREYKNCWCSRFVNAKVYWLIRNPLFNLFAYWLGWLGTGKARSLAWSWHLGLGKNRYIDVQVYRVDHRFRYFPRLTVRLGWFEGFVGWRSGGYFNIQANFEHRMRDG